MVTNFFLLVKLLLNSTANVTHCMQTLPTNMVTTACSALAGLRELVRMLSTCCSLSQPLRWFLFQSGDIFISELLSMWLPWETLFYRHALYLLEELWGTLLYGPSHSEKLRCTAHLREARPSQSEKALLHANAGYEYCVPLQWVCVEIRAN